MSTSSKAQDKVSAAEAPRSGKGMSGTGPDDGTTKGGTGGGSNNPNPGQGHGPKEKDKKGPASNG